MTNTSASEILQYSVYPVPFPGSPQKETLAELIAERTAAGCSHIHLVPVDDDLYKWEALIRMLPRCTEVEDVIDAFYDAGTVLRDKGMLYVSRSDKKMFLSSQTPLNLTAITDREEMEWEMDKLGPASNHLRCFSRVVTRRFMFGDHIQVDALKFVDLGERGWRLVLRVRLPIESKPVDEIYYPSFFSPIFFSSFEYPTFEKVEQGRTIELQEVNMTIVESNGDYRDTYYSLPPSLDRLFTAYQDQNNALFQSFKPTVLTKEEEESSEAEFDAFQKDFNEGIEELRNSHCGEWLVRIRGASDPEENRDFFFRTHKQAMIEARRIDARMTGVKRITVQHLVEPKIIDDWSWKY